MLKAKLGDDYQKTSAAFICATLKRLYGARKNGSKKEVFGYVNGGYANVLEKLKLKLNTLGIEVLTGEKIKEVIAEPNGKVSIHRNAGEPMDFDYVISTLPSHLTAKIGTGLTASEIEKLNNINYLGVICVSLILKKSLTPFYVTNITDENIPLTGVIEMTALVDKKYFGGNALIYLPKYLSSYDPMFDLSDEAIKKVFLDNLKKMQPDLKEEDIVVGQVSKARFVITLPEFEYSKKLPESITSIPNFFIINSSYIVDGTLNVNETLRVADTYLPKVLKSIHNA